MTSGGNSALLPANVDQRPPLQRGYSSFKISSYVTYHLMTGPSRNSEFCFRRISVFFSAAPWETLRNIDICFPRNQSLASLSDDDGDGNEHSNKVIGLDKQNNTFARVSRILYFSLTSLHDYDVKLANFTFFEEQGQKRGRGSNSLVKCWRCRITFAFVWRKNVDSLCTLRVK